MGRGECLVAGDWRGAVSSAAILAAPTGFRSAGWQKPDVPKRRRERKNRAASLGMTVLGEEKPALYKERTGQAPGRLRRGPFGCAQDRLDDKAGKSGERRPGRMSEEGRRRNPRGRCLRGGPDRRLTGWII